MSMIGGGDGQGEGILYVIVNMVILLGLHISDWNSILN